MPRSECAVAATLRDIASQFQPALNRLPSLPSVHTAQRAVGVLVRALEDVIEEVRRV